MPPPSPVWDWTFPDRKRVFRNARLTMRVRVGDEWHASNVVELKLIGVEEPKKK